MFKIEPLTLKNIPYAVALGKELHSLGSLNVIPYDDEYARLNVEQAAINPSYFVRLALDENDTYVGVVAGYLTPFVFSKKLMAIETCWYVREGVKERTKIAVTLMKQFVNWALKENNATHVQTGDIANINSLAVDTVYRHIGFTRIGTIYMMENK